MSTTYSDIEDCLSRLVGPDMTYQTSLSVSALREAISTVIEREASAAIAAAVQAERDTTERYRADWRSVCNALNTSPDSQVAIVLAKIKTLQDSAAARARRRDGIPK